MEVEQQVADLRAAQQVSPLQHKGIDGGCPRLSGQPMNLSSSQHAQREHSKRPLSNPNSAQRWHWSESKFGCCTHFYRLY